MSRIVPKLNLNKTPQLVENNSLIMAKNIRLLDDGTIGPDTSLENIETYSGEATVAIVHHNAVTQEMKYYQYSVLDCETALDIALNSTAIDESNLNSLTFDFGEYHSEAVRGESEHKYFVKVNSDRSCTVYCYSLNSGHISWTKELFNYDINSNRLVNGSGFCLFLAVRDDIYDNSGTAIATNYPEYFYAVLPSKLLGHSIELYEDITVQNEPAVDNISEEPVSSTVTIEYHIINPVYQTVQVETVTISQAYDEEVTTYDTVKYIAQIVGLNNKVYFFREQNYIQYNATIVTQVLSRFPGEVFVGTTPGSGERVTLDVDSEGYITRNGIRIEDAYLANIQTPPFNDRVKIFEYDEIDKTFTKVKCAWKYSGGEINGCVSVNNTGEVILTICEYNVPNNKLVPIKHINLAKCSINDDESIYTQAPNIPITNLLFHDYYTQQIPNGVYQFFIRYEIRKDFYTNWFPCSTELSTATKDVVNTIQGSLRYAELHEDSNQSFIFKVEHLYPSYTKNFIKFQIGFILSHDNSIVARSWKSFDIEDSNNTFIYFDYDKNAIEEINIDELLETTYDLYNVENIAKHKNKLYISNFIETDLNDDNEDLQNFANNITINLNTKQLVNETYYSLNSYNLTKEIIGGSEYFTYYFDNENTHPTSDMFYDAAWCNRPAGTYTENFIAAQTFNFLTKKVYYRHHEWSDDEYEYEDFDLPAGVQDAVDAYFCLYRLYFINEDNQEIDLIADNTSYISSQAPIPSGILNSRSRVGIRNKAADEIKNHIIGIKKQDECFYVQYIQNGTTKRSKIDKFYCVASILYLKDQITTTDYSDPDWTSITSYYNRYERLTYLAEYETSLLYNVKYNVGISSEESQTLIPFTNYDFYCHFITKNGIITNGYFIKSIKINKWGAFIPEEREGYTIISYTDSNQCLQYGITVGSVTYENNISNVQTTEQLDAVSLPTDRVVYPSFHPGNSMPSDYVGYFISMYKHNNNVSHIVYFDKTGNEYRCDCLDCDTMLNGVYDKLIIKDWKGDIISTNGKYAPSGITNPIDKFGDTGFIYFENNGALSETRFWIVGNDYTTDNKKSLIKVTPYKKGNTAHTIIRDEFLQGYYCITLKLKHASNNNRLYINASDIYDITFNTSDANEINLSINENKQSIQYSVPTNIYSNYNLSFISLNQDVSPKIRTYYIQNNGEEISEKQIIYSVDSLLASYVYTLENTFKEYTRKLFIAKEDNKTILFNNVLRCSSIDIDENYRYIYHFDATDYYTVPTQRGIITNLIAIANSLYVHCEHSLFKFTDNKTLDAQDEAVTLQENDIFNSGISEVFDAQYGYAGLKNRKQSLITYNAYVFYDEVAKTIYAFGGEQQIGNISESIKKLIDAINPIDVQFVGDELHNRFFVNFVNNIGNVCLSFNFISKSFISVHDINFNFGFHTRRHTYFIHNNKYNTDIIGWSLYRIVDKIQTTISKTNLQLVDNYIAYRNCYTPSLIGIYDVDNDLLNEVNSANACVDIIINTDYETIKTINSIRWICSEILDYGKYNNFVAEESLDTLYPGTKIRIYTDSTETELFELLDSNGNPKIANYERNVDDQGNLIQTSENQPIGNPNTYKYPRYDNGVWNMNYFRNIRKLNDIFNYLADKNKITGGEGHSATTDLTPKQQRNFLTQENSLIYGKYFVVRFIFNNKNFKLENIIANMKYYDTKK